jgi:hypothetical protein
MTTKTRTPINWTYVTAVVIVYTFIIGTVLVSFSHIVDVSHTLGLRWEAYTVPFLVDGIALLGKLGRSARFAESTQRAGLKLMAFGGLLSLACNVAAGDNTGQRAYGVLVVVGFMVAEWYASKLRPAPVPPARTARRCEPGCTCGKHTRKTASVHPVAAIQALPANAPTSPAPAAAPRPPRTRIAQRRVPVSPLTGRPLVVDATA